MKKVAKIFCEGIGCEFLGRGEDKEGPWVTCTAKECPYSKEEVKNWYKGHRDGN